MCRPSTSRSVCRTRVDLWSTAAAAAAAARPLTSPAESSIAHASLNAGCSSTIRPCVRPVVPLVVLVCPSVSCSCAACARHALIIHLFPVSVLCSLTSASLSVPPLPPQPAPIITYRVMHAELNMRNHNNLANNSLVTVLSIMHLHEMRYIGLQL